MDHFRGAPFSLHTPQYVHLQGCCVISMHILSYSEREHYRYIMIEGGYCTIAVMTSHHVM